MGPIYGIGLLFLLLNCIFVHTVTVKPGNNCMTPNSQPGVCVVINECKNLFDMVLNHHRSESDTKFLEDSRCDRDSRQSKVCCEANAHAEYKIQQQSAYAAPNIAGDRLPKLEECGKPGNHPWIISGTETNLDDFPWMAAIEYGRKDFGCAGSLFAPKYILTAAHCVGDTRYGKPTYVHLGVYNKTNPGIDCKKNQADQTICNDPKLKIAIEEHIRHPNYRITQHTDDIGLIRLSTAVTYTNYISPVCLPFRDITDVVGPNDYFTVAGWGTTERYSESDIKLKVNIPYVNPQTCKQFYPTYPITDRQLCAGGEKRMNPCGTDSGGPLMSLLSPQNRIIMDGIVNHGSDCRLYNDPIVYTKVFSYINWINTNMRP